MFQIVKNPWKTVKIIKPVWKLNKQQNSLNNHFKRTQEIIKIITESVSQLIAFFISLLTCIQKETELMSSWYKSECLYLIVQCRQVSNVTKLHFAMNSYSQGHFQQRNCLWSDSDLPVFNFVQNKTYWLSPSMLEM